MSSPTSDGKLRNRGGKKKSTSSTPDVKNKLSEEAFRDCASASPSDNHRNKVDSPLRRCRRLLHWGTLLAQFLITSISITFLYCDTYFWPVATTRGIDWGAFLHVFIFCASSVLTQYNFLMAIFVGPGYVPKMWKPEEDQHQTMLQYCSVCEGGLI